MGEKKIMSTDRQPGTEFSSSAVILFDLLSNFNPVCVCVCVCVCERERERERERDHFSWEYKKNLNSFISCWDS